MRILITGNMGYVGPSVVNRLRAVYPQASLIGLDAAYFAGCLVDPLMFPERQIDCQYLADIRHLPTIAFNGVDAVVHLAGISNDPIGNIFQAVTTRVNYDATIEIAQRAKCAGVRSFVFASSCSVYGFAEDTPRTEKSTVNPLTAYAKSKVDAERGLERLASDNFVVTCLRFATACGMSPRLRLDLVLNDFVAAALTTGEVRVLSNGTPWRPLIDVKDMSRAVEWGLGRGSENGGAFLVVNTGCDEWTYQVRDLAQAVADAVPGAVVSINRNAQSDARSYKVDFSLFRRLAPLHLPKAQLSNTISELKLALEAAMSAEPHFHVSRFIRLSVLSDLLRKGFVDSNLAWSRPDAGLPQREEDLAHAGAG
jgi:nucleoside-diphosphate-sugar epimerase